MKERFC